MVAYKHPLKFLPSLFTYRTEIDRNITAPREWDAFLRERFSIHDGRKGRTAELSFANPVEYWNALYINLLDLPVHAFRRCFVSYERVRQSPQRELAPVARWAGLKRHSGDFEVPKGRLSRGAPGWRPSSFSRATSVERHQLDAAQRASVEIPEFTSAQRDFVMSQIAPRLAEGFGADLQAAA